MYVMNNILFIVFIFFFNVIVNIFIRIFVIDGIILCIVYIIFVIIFYVFSFEMFRWIFYKKNVVFKIFMKIRFWILMIKYMFVLIFNYKCFYFM